MVRILLPACVRKLKFYAAAIINRERARKKERGERQPACLPISQSSSFSRGMGRNDDDGSRHGKGEKRGEIPTTNEAG